MAGYGYAPSQLPIAAPSRKAAPKARKAPAKAPAKTGTRPQRDPDSPPRVLGQSLVRSGPAPAAPRYNPGTYEKPQAPVYKPILPVPQYSTSERGRPAAPAPVVTADSGTNVRGRPVAPTVEGAPQNDANTRGRPVELPPKNPAVVQQTQAGIAPANAPTVTLGAPPPIPTDGVRELLNAQNWKMPDQKKRVRMPDTAFEKGTVDELEQHDYTVTDEEWNRIKSVYGTKEAAALGYSPPAPTTNVDKTMPLMHLGEQESAALTWDAYQKLSTDQRAAVDFNTLLVQAREKDLDKPVELTGVDRSTYDQRVDKMFGTGHGSDTVAPATLDLLSKVDMDVVGQDLDEYLSLDRAIDTSELPDFKFSKDAVKAIDQMVNGTPPSYNDVRTPENLAAVDTAGIQKTQQMIKTALQDPAALTYDFNSLVNGPTAQMQQNGTLVGYGDANTQWTNPKDAQLDGWFKTGMEVLKADDPAKFGVPKGTDPMSWLLEDLHAYTGGDKQAEQKFLDYVQGQTQLRGQYGSKQDVSQAARVDKLAGFGG